jgi:hypothetical protein
LTHKSQERGIHEHVGIGNDLPTLAACWHERSAHNTIDHLDLVGWSVGTFISAFWESPSLCTFCGGLSIISGTLSSTTFCHCTFRDRLECVSSSLSRNAPAISYCQIWSLLSFFLSLRTAVSLYNRNEPSTQHPSTKPPSSRSSEHYCNTTHQRQLIVPKPQSLSATYHAIIITSKLRHHLLSQQYTIAIPPTSAYS